MTVAEGPLLLAGHTLGTPGETPAGAIKLFAGAGLDAAELIWQDGYRSGIPESGNRAVLEDVRAACADTGLRVIGLTPYMTGLNSLDEGARAHDLKRFRACIADASALGARVVRVYAGSYTDDEAEDRGRMWDALVGSLKNLAPHAGDAGVTLVVENHFNTMTVTAQQSVDLIAAVDSPSVRILYDQANLTFTHSESPDRAVQLQAALIGHVHAKDLVFVDRDRPFSASAVANVTGEQRSVRSRVIGDGELDWADIMTRLLATGYAGAVSLEYEYRWHPQDLPEPAEGFRRGAEALRRILRDVAAG